MKILYICALFFSLVTSPFLAQTTNSVSAGEDFTSYPGYEEETYSVDISEDPNVFIDLTDSRTIDSGTALFSTTYWGKSYAKSEETLNYFYKGTAYAAGNLYQDKIIVGVCIQYAIDGDPISEQVCSNAREVRPGRWIPTSEATVSTRDTIKPWVGKTIFNYKLKKVNP